MRRDVVIDDICVLTLICPPLRRATAVCCARNVDIVIILDMRARTRVRPREDMMLRYDARDEAICRFSPRKRFMPRDMPLDARYADARYSRAMFFMFDDAIRRRAATRVMRTQARGKMHVDASTLRCYALMRFLRYCFTALLSRRERGATLFEARARQVAAVATRM